MSEPKSLSELMKDTERILGSASEEKDSSSKLLDDVIKSGGTLSRAANEKSEGAAQPAARETAAEPGSLLSVDGAVGVVKGVGKGFANLVTDTKNLFFNTDHASITQAARRGDYATSSGFNFLTSVGKSGSEMGSALATIVSRPSETFTRLGSQIAGDYSKGSSEKKGEMVGEGLAFALTLGIGTSQLSKGFRSLTRLDDASAAARFVGETAALGREGRLISEAGKVAGVGREARIVSEAGAVTGVGREAILLRGEGLIGESTAFLKAGRPLAEGGALADGSRLAGRMLNLSDDAMRMSTKLETTVGGLAKPGAAARELASGDRLAGLSRLSESTDLAGFTRLKNAERALLEFEGASRALTGQTKIARELSLAGEGGAAARIGGKEAQVLAREARSVEEAVTAVRTAQSEAARQVALRELQGSVTRYNSAIEGSGLSRSLTAELKIGSESLARFEVSATRVGELAGFGKAEATASKLAVAEKATVELEASARSITGKLDDAKAVTTATRSESTAALSQKSLEIEQGMQRVRAAETAVAREQAILELRSNVRQYNALVEGSPATATRAAELRISEKSLVEFEAAARQANRAHTLYTAEASLAKFDAKTGALYQDVQKGRTAVEGSQVSGAYQARAREVEESLARLRTAETGVAREKALTELRQSVDNYNRFIETNAVTASRAAELKVSQQALYDLELAARESRHARTLVTTEEMVTTSALRSDFASQSVLQDMSRGRTFATNAAKSDDVLRTLPAAPAEALNIERQAMQVESSLAMAQRARTGADFHWAAGEAQASIKAYNEAIMRSPLTASRASEFMISDSVVKELQAASRQFNHSMRLAEAEVLRTGDYTSRLAGRYGFLAADSSATQSAIMSRPLSSRADGLIEVSGREGWFRSRLRALDESAGSVWRGVVHDGLKIQGLTWQHAKGAAQLGLGVYIVGRDMYLLYDRTLDRVARMNQEDAATSAAAARAGTAAARTEQAGTARGEQAGTARGEQAGTARGEQGGTARAEQAGTARTEQAGTARGEQGGTARTEQAGTARGEQGGTARGEQGGTARGEQAGTAAGRPGERQAAPAGEAGTSAAGNDGSPARRTTAGDGRQAGETGGASGTASDRQGGVSDRQQADQPQATMRSRQDEPALSPALHALRSPGYQAVPGSLATTAAFIEMRREESRRKRQNQFGEDWFGPHVYLKGAEPQPAGDAPAVLPFTQHRRFGGSEPEVPRIVTPTFKPQIIYATQAQLFGTAGRGHEQGPAAVSGTDAPRRVRGGSANDEQKLVKMYPFLSAAAGETGMVKGSKTVFKLAGVEGRERAASEKGGGAATAPAQPVAVLPAASEPPAASASAAGNQPDEE